MNPDIPISRSPGLARTAGFQPISAGGGFRVSLESIQRAASTAPQMDARGLAMEGRGLAALGQGIGDAADAVGRMQLAHYESVNRRKVDEVEAQLAAANDDIAAELATEPDTTKWSSLADKHIQQWSNVLRKDQSLSPAAREVIESRLSIWEKRSRSDVSRSAAQTAFKQEGEGLEGDRLNAMAAGDWTTAQAKADQLLNRGLVGADAHARMGIQMTSEQERKQKEAFKGTIATAIQTGAVADLEAVKAQLANMATAKSITAKATKYGYQADPYRDSNSLAGIGNRGNKLTAGKSVALSEATAKKLGLDVKSGGKVKVTIGGQSFEASVDDTIPPDYDEDRIDFYSPDGKTMPVPDGAEVTISRVGEVDGVEAAGMLDDVDRAIARKKSVNFEGIRDLIFSNASDKDFEAAITASGLGAFNQEQLREIRAKRAADLASDAPFDPAEAVKVRADIAAFDPDKFKTKEEAFLAYEGLVLRAELIGEKGRKTGHMTSGALLQGLYQKNPVFESRPEKPVGLDAAKKQASDLLDTYVKAGTFGQVTTQIEGEIDAFEKDPVTKEEKKVRKKAMVDQYNPAVAQKIITVQRQVEDELTAAVQAGSLNANDPDAVDKFVRGRMSKITDAGKTVPAISVGGRAAFESLESK